MFPFRFVRRSRRPAVAPSRVTVFAPKVDRLEDRTTPAGAVGTNTLTFAPGNVFPTSLTFDGPSLIRSGDFDGDGFDDFVSLGTGLDTDTFEVGLNNGDGTFTTKIFSPVNDPIEGVFFGRTLGAVAVGDFVGADGKSGADGLADIAVGVQGVFGADQAQVIIYRATGGGALAAGTPIPVGPPTVGFSDLQTLAAGDLNGDGRLDLFVTRGDADVNGTPLEYVSLLNQGNGTFKAADVSKSGKAGAADLDRPVIADVDRDGKADVVTFSGAFGVTANQAFVFWGRGDGTFDAPATITGANDVNAVAALDMDADGALDIAVAEENTNQLTVYFQGTDIVLDPVTGLPTVDPVTGNPVVVGDRKFPASLAQTRTFQIQGLSIFTPNVTELAVADFNFDQVADLVAVNNNFLPASTLPNPTYPLVSVFLGSAVSRAAIQPAVGSPLQTRVSPQAVAVGNFAGNELPDILVGGDFFKTKYQMFTNSTQVGGVVTISDDASKYTFSDPGNSVFVGQPVTFTACVSKFLAPVVGNIEFYAVRGATSTLIGTVPLDTAGIATLTVTDFSASAMLPPGAFEVQAKFVSGNDSYDDSQVSEFFFVRPLDTQTTLASTDNLPVFGQPITVTAKVAALRPTDPFGRPFGPPVTVAPGDTPPGALVVLYDNGNPLLTAPVDANGLATFDLTSTMLALGDHPFEAKYLGDTRFTGSQSFLLPVRVQPANSSTTLTASPRAVNFGDPVDLTATVTIVAPGQGSPDGVVRFTRVVTNPDGTTTSTQLADVFVTPAGEAKTTDTPPTAGKFEYLARFLDTASVAGSGSAAARITVAPTISSAAVSVSATGSLADVVPVTVTVTDPLGRPVSVGTVDISATLPDGTVRLVGDDIPVVNGAAVLPVRLRDFGLGDTMFEATFSGSSSITPADATAASTTVVKATPAVTFTNTAGGQTVTLSKDVTFTVSFAPVGQVTELATGTVVFLDNGTPLATVPLANGKASFVGRLALGGHTVTAQYAGDDLYAANTFSTPVTVVRPVEGFVASAAAPGADRVLVFNADGSFNKTVFAFGPDATTGVRVATGDLTGDGVSDYAVGTGPGSTARVRVLDGTSGEPLFEIFPFEDFTGGVFVAVGDANGDRRPDLIITPDEGGGPRVRIFSGNSFGQIADYFGIEDPGFRGGARAAVGDVNADGFGDVVVSAGFSGGPRVAFWDGRGFAAQGQPPRKLFNDFFAFESGLRNGAYVAVGDLDGDGFADPIFGAGPGGSPRVLAMSGLNLSKTAGANRTLIANFFAGDVNDRGGVPVTARTMDGDALTDIVTGSASGGNAVSVWAGSLFVTNPTPSAPSRTISVFDDGSNPMGGVFVG